MLAAESTPVVPFWLQVLTIALAPILGFAGVAVGAYLNGRASDRAWRKQRQLEAYLELLELGSEISSFTGTQVTTAARTRDIARIRVALRGLQGYLPRLQHLIGKTQLVGSQDVAAAATGLMTPYFAVLLYFTKSLGRGDAQFDQLDWTKQVVDPVIKAVGAFRDAAANDFSGNQLIIDAPLEPDYDSLLAELQSGGFQEPKGTDGRKVTDEGAYSEA